MNPKTGIDTLPNPTGTEPPTIHIVPHRTWPIALCGYAAEVLVLDTRGRDRCTECLRLSRTHRFDPASPPPVSIR